MNFPRQSANAEENADVSLKVRGKILPRVFLRIVPFIKVQRSPKYQRSQYSFIFLSLTFLCLYYFIVYLWFPRLDLLFVCLFILIRSILIFDLPRVCRRVFLFPRQLFAEDIFLKFTELFWYDRMSFLFEKFCNAILEFYNPIGKKIIQLS